MADERRYSRYHTVAEAARVLSVTPARIREMAATGALESLPPGATQEGDWKVLLPDAQSAAQLPSELIETDTEYPDVSPESAPGPMHGETSTQTPDEDARHLDGEQPANTRHTSAEPESESGWATTEVAAEALGVSPRTVRDYIANGKLDAKPEGEGVERRWLVSIDSVHSLRQTRQSAGRLPRDRREIGRSGEPAAEIAADLLMRVQDLQYKLGRAEARAEITERAESTVREERDRLLADLRRERQRADEERERAERLESALEALREVPLARETTAAGRDNTEDVIEEQNAPQPPDSPGPTQKTPTDAPRAAQEATERPFTQEEPVAQPSRWASPWLDAVIAILVVGGIAGLALLITLILSL